MPNEICINHITIVNKQNYNSNRSIGSKIPIFTKQTTSMPNM